MGSVAMMSDLRTAAQQALEAMESADFDPHSSDAIYKAITALRAALEADDGVYGARALAQAYENGWNAQAQRKPLSVTDLQEALVYANLIDRDAIDDPDGYDEGSTLAQIDVLHRAITGDAA